MYNAFAPQKIAKDTLQNDIKETAAKTDSSQVTDEKDKKNLAVASVTAIENSKKGKTPKSKITYPYVKKLSERSTKTAKRITYIDAVQQGSTDTITLFIALENESLLSGDSTKKIIPGKNKKKTQKEINRTDSLSVKTISSSKNILPNVDCSNPATDHDVDELREKILAENTIESKIAMADKYFKTKCFSTKQIKTLSELFASDKSKYNFFQTAYPFISDKENSAQLVTSLSDTVYINRFKKRLH